MTTIKYKDIDQVPTELKTQLRKYFSNLEGNTFLVDNLPPQMTGALLARYSRVDYSTRLTLVNEFLDDQGNFDIQHANKLVDRVLNAFGDDSVGELEKGIIVGIEGASNLLTKEIEDRRIGGSSPGISEAWEVHGDGGGLKPLAQGRRQEYHNEQWNATKIIHAPTRGSPCRFLPMISKQTVCRFLRPPKNGLSPFV